MSNSSSIFLLLILLCYAFGCISTGYYIVSIFASKDVRNIGSKSTGATNVGRVMGRKGFFITGIIDVIKGILVICLCKVLNFNDYQSLICAISLACGHIWPIQLKFHGGKGIAVLLGFFIIWNPLMVLITIIFGLLLYLILKNLSISGLIGFLVLPIYVQIEISDLKITSLILLILMIVYFAHRENIITYFMIQKTKR